MPGGRIPGPNSLGPKRSRNLTPEERSQSQLERRGTRGRQKKFFNELSKTLKIQVTLRKMKMSRHTFGDWMRKDKWFQAQYSRFIREAILNVEAKGISLASRGSKRKHYSKAVGFYFNREYSPELIKFFLKSHKPSTYGNRLGLNIDINQAVQIILPHNNRDEKNVIKPKEPCGAKVK